MDCLVVEFETAPAAGSGAAVPDGGVTERAPLPATVGTVVSDVVELFGLAEDDNDDNDDKDDDDDGEGSSGCHSTIRILVPRSLNSNLAMCAEPADTSAADRGGAGDGAAAILGMRDVVLSRFSKS